MFGSNVVKFVNEMHRILLYLPRHECFVTRYRERYSGSSVGAAVEVVDAAGAGVWRETKSIWERLAKE